MLLRKENQGKTSLENNTFSSWSLEINAKKISCQKKIIIFVFRSENEGKVITSMKTTKESPSGGEKLLRLLASGTGGANEAAKSPVSQTLKNMPLNFAQGNSYSYTIFHYYLQPLKRRHIKGIV